MKKVILIAILAAGLSIDSSSCTTAIISGKATPDGRPMLWKHRDTDSFNNKIVYVRGEKYAYYGLVDSDDTLHQVWAGTNSAGFSIMNSASYNLKPSDDKTEFQDQEGMIMKHALATCATLNDFKRMLDSLPKPLGVEANFGVIDAQGGAAYFETNNFKYTVYDANNPAIAPNGYLIRTNFSVSGKLNEGAGYNRFETATKLLADAYKSKKITPTFFLNEASLCLKQEITHLDLSLEFKKLDGPNKMYPFRDFIVRYLSSSTIVVQGVKPKESPLLSTTWVKLGFQPASISIPIWLAMADTIPTMITAPGIKNAKLCSYALTLKKKCFPYAKWAEGENYISLDKLGNKQEEGILQLIKPFDKEIINRGEKLIQKWRRLGFDATEAISFYSEIEKQVDIFYKQSFSL